MNDWKILAAARGLELSDPELEKLGSVMEALAPAYELMAAGLTVDIEPATVLHEEALLPE